MQYLVKMRVIERYTKTGRRNHFKAGQLAAISRQHAEHIKTALAMVSSEKYDTHAMVFARINLPMHGNLDVCPDDIKEVADAFNTALRDIENDA